MPAVPHRSLQHLVAFPPARPIPFPAISPGVPTFYILRRRQFFRADSALPQHFTDRAVILHMFPSNGGLATQTLFLHIVIRHFSGKIFCRNRQSGQKSARGRVSFTPNFAFISCVVRPPKRAWSPFERLPPNPASSTPLS